jgi:trafficking protein particle complex subunit 2
MASRVPGIACIAIIGKQVCPYIPRSGRRLRLTLTRQNNPLLISLFPPDRDALEYHFLLSSSLDIFDIRAPHQTADQDFGLLQAVDERLAMYGWLTNTGVKFVIVLDMAARVSRDAKPNAALGVKDSDLKPVGSLRASCF